MTSSAPRADEVVGWPAPLGLQRWRFHELAAF